MKFKKFNQKANLKQTYLLIGAPNVGKSSFFNCATRATTTVSNIDRMTTDHTFGKIKGSKDKYLVDLPGLYNLSHPVQEEKEVAHHLIEHTNKGILNIVSALSLERDLYLTLQCAESGLLRGLVINLVDKVYIEQINLLKLSKKLNGLSITPTITSKKRGVKTATDRLLHSKTNEDIIIKYDIKIEYLIKKLSNLLPEMNISKRYASIMLLEKNSAFSEFLQINHNKIYVQISNILKKQNLDLFENNIKEAKQKWIKTTLQECIIKKDKWIKINLDKQNKIDRYFLKPWIGIPIFIIIIFLIYYLTFGAYTGGWIQSNFQSFLVDIVANKWIYNLFQLMHVGSWVTDMFVSGIFGGLFIIVSFLPTIIILFFMVSLIQQSGLLSRMSILLDNTLSRFGLSGRSVVNLLTGFGCNVPAIMMARSSSSKKERIISVIIAPFVACGSRVIVLNFITAIIFPSSYAWIITFSLVVLSGLITLLFALIFSNTLFRKEKSFFLIEMVNWSVPNIMVICKSIWIQVKEFLIKATTVIIIFNFIFWLLMHLGPNGLIEPKTEKLYETSFLYYISFGLSYIFFPIFGTVNWQLTSSLLSGIVAKELIISNIELISNFNPEMFFTTLSLATCISYLIFMLFYMPCMPTMFTLKKEVGWKYMSISLLTGFGIAYVLAALTYWLTFACFL